MLPKGVLKEYAILFSWCTRALDMLAVFFAGWLAYVLRFHEVVLTKNYLIALTLGSGYTVFIFSLCGLYQSARAQPLMRFIWQVVQAQLIVLLLLAGSAFLTKTGQNYSRIWFSIWALCSLGLLSLSRLAIFSILRLMRTHGFNERRVLIVGDTALALQMMQTIQHALWTGFSIVACVPCERQDLSQYLTSGTQAIDEIWIALPLSATEQVKEIQYQLRHHTVTVRLILDVAGLDLLQRPLINVVGYPAVNLNTTPMMGINRLIKACEDRLLALLILILISPLLLVIALTVKLTSNGPVIFKQLRHGWDGRLIKVYKFRTMYIHQEQAGQVTQASVNDRRITPVGKFLRRTSLDELPQFFNVLQGRMSLVGPRPHAVVHNEFYKDVIPAYMQRHKVKPGITGWAQVNGWRGETKSVEDMQKRVEYDLYYIEHWSLWLDLKIIFLTLIRGFVHKNAY